MEEEEEVEPWAQEEMEEEEEVEPWTDEKMEEVFTAGNEAFESENYGEAIKNLEELAKRSIEDEERQKEILQKLIDSYWK